MEMVFNIRPFAEEFLNTMAKDFEIVVFTAGEQDVSIKSAAIQTNLLMKDDVIESKKKN